jgi:hypothetical protein
MQGISSTIQVFIIHVYINLFYAVFLSISLSISYNKTISFWEVGNWGWLNVVSMTSLLQGQQLDKLTLKYRDIAEGLEHLNENILKSFTQIKMSLH